MTRGALWLLILASAVAAPGQVDPPSGEDEPGRGVARISVINGDVSIRRGDSGDWIAAAVNAPLIVEDRVHSGPGSRAEVQFDWANMIRLGSDTEIQLSELEYRRYQVQLASGTVTYRVLRESDAQAEINTPSVSVRPVREGSYRISVRPDGSSEITVRSGEAEIFTPQGAETLRAGQTMLARGPYSDPEYQIVAEIERDDWDHWNESRDRDLKRSASYRYVNPDIYGAEDLDGHGVWIEVAPYGWVWAPHVAVGWAPYRFGRWVWIDWYGWSWVSYDPWGWAPYHYGRWFWHSNRWCWWPGPRRGGVPWRPALVGFVGWSGGGVSVGVGFGRVGWFPLAPYEPYYPWYGRRWYRGYRNHAFIDNSVTIVNNTNITNIYRNARFANAVTVVDGRDFSRGRAGNLVRVGTDDLRRASLVRGPVPVVPERESLRLTEREPRWTGSSRTFSNDRFFRRGEPTPVSRVSFEDQRRGVERIARSTFGIPGGSASIPERSGATAGRENIAGWRRLGDRSVAGPAGDRANGWRRADPPSSGFETLRAADRSTERSGGWRSFGRPAGGRPNRQAEGMDRSGSQGWEGRSSSGWHRFGDPRRSTVSGFDRGPGFDRPSVDRGISHNPVDRGFSRQDRSPADRVRSRGGNGDFGRVQPPSTPRAEIISPRGSSRGNDGFLGKSRGSYDFDRAYSRGRSSDIHRGGGHGSRGEPPMRSGGGGGGGRGHGPGRSR
jgi:FecR protein.